MSAMPIRQDIFKNAPIAEISPKNTLTMVHLMVKIP
jgi:hypothetical protein